MAEEDDVPPAFIFKDKHLNHLSKIKAKDKYARKKVMAIIGNTEITNKFIFYDFSYNILSISSLIISLLVSFFAQKRIIKITFFSITFAFFSTFWFKTQEKIFLRQFFLFFS